MYKSDTHAVAETVQNRHSHRCGWAIIQHTDSDLHTYWLKHMDFVVGGTVRRQSTLVASVDPNAFADYMVLRTPCLQLAPLSMSLRWSNLVSLSFISFLLHHKCASGLQTSAQSLPGVIGGVASIVGNAGGGWIMQNYGSTVLYRTTSAMVLCSTVLFVCFSAYQKSKLAQKMNEASASESSL